MSQLKRFQRVTASPDKLAIVPPYAWLVVFLLIPFFIVLKISFGDPDGFGMPEPLVSFKDKVLTLRLYLEGYWRIVSDPLFVHAYLQSLKMAAITTLLCIVIGYPMAYHIARAKPNTRNILLLLVILPFWTSLLLRVYAWVGILRNEGLLNSVLLWLGVIDSPLSIYRTDIAVYIGLVYTYLPFFILPLYTNLLKLDQRLLDAASDLGARPWTTFLRITLPLSMPGLIAGGMLVFIPTVGEYVIPELLGGTDTYLMGRVMWDQYFGDANWPVASAVAVLMILLLLVPLVIYQRNQAKLMKQGGV